MRNTLLAGLLTTLAVFGADISGTWKGQVNRPDGQLESTAVLQLRQNGNRVSGDIGSGSSDTAPIENAKLDGNKLYFEVTGDSSTFRVTLDVAADAMKGSVVRVRDGQESPAMAMELKRDK